MTRTLEERMEAIQQGKETKQKVLQNAIETLKLVTSELKEKEAEIGAQVKPTTPEKTGLTNEPLEHAQNATMGNL